MSEGNPSFNAPTEAQGTEVQGIVGNVPLIGCQYPQVTAWDSSVHVGSHEPYPEPIVLGAQCTLTGFPHPPLESNHCADAQESDKIQKLEATLDQTGATNFARWATTTETASRYIPQETLAQESYIKKPLVFGLWDTIKIMLRQPELGRANVAPSLKFGQKTSLLKLSKRKPSLRAPFKAWNFGRQNLQGDVPLNSYNPPQVTIWDHSTLLGRDKPSSGSLTAPNQTPNLVEIQTLIQQEGYPQRRAGKAQPAPVNFRKRTLKFNRLEPTRRGSRFRNAHKTNRIPVIRNQQCLVDKTRQAEVSHWNFQDSSLALAEHRLSTILGPAAFKTSAAIPRSKRVKTKSRQTKSKDDLTKQLTYLRKSSKQPAQKAASPTSPKRLRVYSTGKAMMKVLMVANLESRTRLREFCKDKKHLPGSRHPNVMHAVNNWLARHEYRLPRLRSFLGIGRGALERAYRSEVEVALHGETHYQWKALGFAAPGRPLSSLLTSVILTSVYERLKLMQSSSVVTNMMITEHQRSSLRRLRKISSLALP